MRRYVWVGALVVVAACGKGEDAAPTQPPMTPETVPAVPTPPTGDPSRWVAENIEEGWFASAEEVFEQENEDAAFDPAPTTGGGGPAPAETPAGRPPRRSEGLGARAGDLGLDEENPRFGGPSPEPMPDLDGPADSVAAPGAWQRSTQAAHATRLMVGDEESLPLESFQATVRIDGHRARVVLDLCHRNTYDQDLEGELKLRLPDGAAVHYLAFGGVATESPLMVPAPGSRALDLTPAALTTARGGTDAIREGRIVPREAAQRAYAAETAQAVDPALLEWNGAGIFTTWVYPLEANALSRVTVAYDVDLLEEGDARHLDVGVPTDAARSRVVVENHRGPEHRRVFEDVRDGSVRVSLPARGAAAVVGDDPGIGPHFATSVVLDVPDSQTAPNRRAIFLVDASMSSNAERMNVWTDLLRAILERNRGELDEFAVLFFNVETWWWRERLAPNEAETVETLLRDVRQLALEGATDLDAALREARAPSWTTTALDADVFLLSDGSQTWGNVSPVAAAEGLDRPLFCYTTGLPGTDTRTLSDLARTTGGAVFSVPSARDVAGAAVAHRAVPWTLREIRVPGCSDVLVAGRPASVYPGQRLRVAGRGRPVDGDTVVLTLEQGGRTHDVRVPFAEVIRSDLAARAYGEIATGQLESLGDAATAESRAYALHYGVTGETCSLLMLETEEDYLEYGIVRTADAETVRRRPVSAVLSALSAEAERARRDAREAFLVWLDRLERLAADAGGLRDLDELREAARSLPVDAFVVRPRALRCRTRTWDDVTGGYAGLMRDADPGYGAVTTEAEGRHSVRGADDALRALSTLVEADPGSVDLRRDIAFTALEWDRPGHAYRLLRRVADARPFEPETYRAIAECLERAGNVDYAMLVHEIALRGSWDERFGAFPLIAAMDYRGLLRRIEHGKAATRLPDLADVAREHIASHFVRGDPDLVVTMTWNTDRTDVDLHVEDPAGEVCKYDHPRTELGGAITLDVVGGYGPEMFVLGRAVPGEYVVRAHYYGSDALRKTLRSRVFVTITRRFGQPDEHRERRAFLLEETDDAAEVTRFTWGE